jgi:L,D-transpeptidase catalytic domain
MIRSSQPGDKSWGKYLRFREYCLCVVFGALLLFCLGAVAAHTTQDAYAQQARFPIGSTVAVTSPVRLLEQPAADGGLVAAMPVNAQATVLGGPFNDGWYWLEYGLLRGYALGSYFTLVDANYTPVLGGSYAGLWLGELTHSSTIRSAPSASSSVRKSWWAGRRVLIYETAADEKGVSWYRVSEAPELTMWVQSAAVRKVAPVQFEQARFTGKWVNVNLAQQVVTAYQDGVPVKVTLASTGTALHPTPPGVWRIFWRLPSQEMRGGSKANGDYYDLPNVPWVQYFQSSGDALHGTYWHDDFGRVHSHGCVNLSIPMAQWFYGWASIGVVVYVH